MGVALRSRTSAGQAAGRYTQNESSQSKPESMGSKTEAVSARYETQGRGRISHMWISHIKNLSHPIFVTCGNLSHS